MSLIIVESPTKARTFNRILKGKDYYVFATLGHIRDLPAATLAVDYEKDFKPEYQILSGRQKVVDQLKKLASQNDEIILASDLDREGEAISYHAAHILGLINETWPDFSFKKTKKKVKRIVFHEITPKALEEALKNPQTLRTPLVQAQQARRILDRVVGYELSPLLWAKLGKNWLSAGRVQTIALRLIVEREKEILAFKQEKYFQIYANLMASEELKAVLREIDNNPVEVQTKIDLFDGSYQYTKTIIDDEAAVTHIKAAKKEKFVVEKVTEEMVKRYPPPPFTTSLLQQDSFYKLGFPSKLTMRLAQNLYERGLITYHRTDSFNLSSHFVFKAKDHIVAKFGSEYALEKPRGYRTKSKSAQEAHEAIRPTDVNRNVNELTTKHKLTANHKKLYQLIFDRALATQMKEADIKQIKLTIRAGKRYLFESESQQVVFDGFLKVLNPQWSSTHTRGVKIAEGEELKLKDLESKENLTKAPARYNEASLIKTLEEKAIGRPSTYAPIISLIQEKLYVDKENRYFKPTSLGTVISDYLSKAFPQIFEIGFTAAMEEGLDQIAEGNQDVVTLLKKFYEPFKKELETMKLDKTKLEVKNDIDEKCPKCDKPLTMRYSKFGKFLACTGYPSCKFTKAILKTVANKKCPKCQSEIVVRYSKKHKRFYGCASYPDCKFTAFSINAI